MLDRLGDEVFGDARRRRRAARRALAGARQASNGHATLRLPLPFVEKGDIELKKIGLEVIVRVGGQKRTIMLPTAMAAYRPRGAHFEDGALRGGLREGARWTQRRHRRTAEHGRLPPRAEWDARTARREAASAAAAARRARPAAAVRAASTRCGAAVPRELQRAVQRAACARLLLTLRALIDWYLERLDRPQREPEVEDIPID